MATSKEAALQKIAAADAKAIEQMRGEIEKKLKTYDGSCAITITPSGTRKAWTAIADEYTDAGWTVNYGNDQRDGAWLTLK